MAGDRAAALAGRLVAEAAGDADRARGFARIAIAGGSAVSAIPEIIDNLDVAARRRARLTWVDERCVDVADPASNRGAALAAGLAARPPGLILALWEDGETPGRAVARVGAALASAFDSALDVTLLGMGPDGHIASLFPGRAMTGDPGDLVAFVADSPKPPPRRITLTRALLATARRSVLFALGEGKRDALERLLAGDPSLPATGLPGLEIVTDTLQPAIAAPTVRTAPRARQAAAHDSPRRTSLTQSHDSSDPGAPRVNDVAVIGLGVMGANLARNFASRGFRVAGYTRDPDGRARFRAEEAERTAGGDAGGAAIDVADSLPALVARLERPRRIVLMVTAGAAVDAVLDALDPLLEEDDIAVDGGNSLYRDTDRRARRAEGRPWRFVGMGVSGGAEGALRGPSMMPGGDPEAWRRLEPVLSKVAAVGPHGPCVTYCGRRSAGHFVKMVHNGIEYGDMQLIAETATLMRDGLGMDPVRVADTFAEWNRGALESYLIDITADIFRVQDPDRPGHLLVDAILDRAGQKGTGRWTVMAAVELGVPVPTIAAALDARALSAGGSIREAAETTLGGRAERGVADGGNVHLLAGIGVAELEAALYASKIASYTQGFQMLTTASEELDYGIDLAEVARIWTAGCIIRARFLDRIREAYSGGEPPALLALAPSFAAELRARLPAWRIVVSAATAAGFAVPGLAASLAWLDTVATARGSASIIQAQRDYFGSHTYRRTDAPDVPVHTEWAQLARKPR